MEDNELHQQIGYLTKAVEDIGEVVKSHTAESKQHYSKIDVRLTKMEDQLSFYKTVARTLKVTGAALLLIATAQWDKLAKLFH